MDFNVALANAAAVKVGEPDQSFTIEVKRTQPDAAASYRVTVTLGCGPKETDLLDSPDGHVNVRWRQGEKTTGMSAVTSPPAGTRAWNTGAFPVGLPVSISFEGFEAKTPPGEAVLNVLVQTSTGANRWSAGETYSIKVRKELAPLDAPAIRYFTVNPNYVLHAGRTEVTASFCATGYDTLTLFRNNEEVRNWAALAGTPPSIIGTFPSRDDFPERPSITSVYRLEGKYTDKKTQEEVRHTLDQTVQVISSGWNQIAMPQGSPVRLFVANDFGGGSARLYGIFKNGAGRYALYSSATGVDAWRPEPGEVPQEVATSPGVVFNNKLWLVGGSSVDPAGAGGRVWCYDKGRWSNGSGGGAPAAWSFPTAMRARMGHACVAVKDEVWVIGGYNELFGAFSDVWSFKEGADGRLAWRNLSPNCQWGARLNHAAVAYRNDDRQDEVWIYGGSEDPQSGRPKNDFWSTRDSSATWQEMSRSSPPVSIVPDPGAPLGSALVTFRPADSSGAARSDRLFLIGSFKEWAAQGAGAKLGNRVSSYLFEWHGGTGLWEARPVFDGWQQFEGQNFYMQAVVYNRFLFCWSLQNDPTFAGKLNILV